MNTAIAAVRGFDRLMILNSTRRICAAEGFRLVATATPEEFGRPVQGDTRRLGLRRLEPAPS